MKEVEILKFKKQREHCDINVMYQSKVSNTYKAHAHDFFEIFVVVYGNAIHLCNGDYEHLTTGDCVLVKPADIHEYKILDNDNFEMVNLAFEVKFFNDMISQIGALKNRKVSMSISEFNLFKEDMAMVYNYLEENANYGQNIILKSVVYRLLCKFAIQVQEARVPYKLANFIQSIKTSDVLYEDNSYFVDLSGYSHTHLNRLCNQYYGKSLTNVILDIKLDIALDKILTTNSRINNIAFDSGFDNISYFNRSFKKKFGCTPSLIRKN